MNNRSTELDPRVRGYVNPVRVRWPEPAPPPPEGAERLIDQSIGQSTVWRTALCTLARGVTSKAEAASLLLDFGQELHGGIQLTIGNTNNNKPTQMRITFGESIAETLGEVNQDHAIHRYDTLVPWAGVFEIGSTGFRFVRLELPEADTLVELLGARAVTLMHPEPMVGSFRCSDDRINAVWATAARTVHLCMQTNLWDGIKRDRLVWAGDLHPEVMAALSVFGGHSVVPASLNFLRDDTPLPKWMNGMPTYSLWWIISLHEWYLHTGDRATLEANEPYLQELLRQVVTHIDADGREVLPARFLDWATNHDAVALAVGAHALLALALQNGAALAKTLGDVELVEACSSAADRASKYTPPASSNQQANALRVLAGLAPAGPYNQAMCQPDPMAGLSPFYAYYVLEARALAGDHSGCLDLLRHYWGGMLDLGATSFWEHFDPTWMADHPTHIDEYPQPGRKDVHRDYGDYCYQGFRHSLCHAWGAGPAAWLHRHVLGVRPVSAGFATVIVEPNLGGLEWAEGDIPTPQGVIHVRVEAAGSEPKVTLTLPDGVRLAAILSV